MSKQKQTEWAFFKSKYFVIGIIIMLAISALIFFITNEAYTRGGGYHTVWDAGTALIYWGSVLSFFGAVFLGAVAIWQNHKLNTINERMQLFELEKRYPYFKCTSVDLVKKAAQFDKEKKHSKEPSAGKNTTLNFPSKVTYFTKLEDWRKGELDGKNYIIKTEFKNISNTVIHKSYVNRVSIHAAFNEINILEYKHFDIVNKYEGYKSSAILPGEAVSWTLEFKTNNQVTIQSIFNYPTVFEISMIIDTAFETYEEIIKLEWSLGCPGEIRYDFIPPQQNRFHL